MAVNLFLLRFSYEGITLYTVFRTRKFITSLVGIQNTNKIFHHYSFSIPHKNSKLSDFRKASGFSDGFRGY